MTKEKLTACDHGETNVEFVKRVFAYCKEATLGRWYWKSNRDIGKGTFDLLQEGQPELAFGILGEADFEGSRFGGIISPQVMANQEFIANARTDLPEACNRLEQLQAENKRLEASNNVLKKIWAGQICPKCGTVFRYQSSLDEIINTDLRANRVIIG